MFKEQMNKFKGFFAKKTEGDPEKVEKPNKRKIENLAFFLIVLIITLIAINSILGGDKKDTLKEEKSSYKVLANDEESNNTETVDLEKKLEKILSTLSGVRESKCFNYIYKIFWGCSNVQWK